MYIDLVYKYQGVDGKQCNLCSITKLHIILPQETTAV